MQNTRYLKQFLQPIESTDAIIGKEQVKLYRHLEVKLISFCVQERAIADGEKFDIKFATATAREQVRKNIRELQLRRMLVPTDEEKCHFYLVNSRQQGINVERTLLQLASIKSAVA